LRQSAILIHSKLNDASDKFSQHGNINASKLK